MNRDTHLAWAVVCVAVGLVVAALLVGHFRAPLDIDRLVFQVADYECAPNQGVRTVRMIGQWGGDRRYTFICKNDAHFLDREVVPDTPKPPVAAEQVLRKEG